MSKSKKISTSNSKSASRTTKASKAPREARGSRPSRKNKRIPPKNPDGSVKISMIKREYRLVEQHGNEVTVTQHFALNKGPGDAAVKLSRPFFKDRNDGSKVRITITKVSDGRNKGALYEYEIVQKHMLLKSGEKAPKGIVIEKNGKKYRLKRYATKLKTYTPSSQKKSKKADVATKNPEISESVKNKIKKIIADDTVRGRKSKTIVSAQKLSKKSESSASSSDATSDDETHITLSE